MSQLQYYTEGNVPEALIGVPASWSPDQIRQFQLYWDSLMEGNIAARRHARFIPGDMKVQPTRDPVLKDPYDEWLARISSRQGTPMFAIKRYRLAQPHGDGRHPYLDGDGAYLGPGIALVERRTGTDGRLHFAPRPEVMLDHVLSKAYGVEMDCGPLMGSLGVVARALDAGNVTLALIALVQAGIEPLPDETVARRFKDADIALRKMLAREAKERARAAQRRAVKYSPDQPRVPAGDPTGGQWTSGEGGDGSASNSSHGSSSDGDAALSDAVYRPGDDSQVAAVPAVSTPELVQSAIAAGVSPTPPDYKNQIVSQGAWVGFNNAVAALPGITPGEQFAYAQIFAAEGGTTPDTSDGSPPSSSGIMASAIATYLPSLAGTAPEDLTDAQRAAFYQAYFEANLKLAGGSGALDSIGGQYTAAAVADVIYENGSRGVGAVQNAVNDVIAGLDQSQRSALGLAALSSDDSFGSGTLNAIRILATNGEAQALRNAIAIERANLPNANAARIAHFQFAGARP